MNEIVEKPKQNRVISAIKSELKVMMGRYLNPLIEPHDTVLQKIGGNYQVYNEILRDDQVQSTFEQRMMAVISSPWEVTPASDSALDKAAADFATEQLNRLKFNDLTKKMLYCRFFGFSVAEIIWAIEDGKYIMKSIDVRDRARFKFDIDCNLRLITVGNHEGTPCEPPYFWVPSVGATHDDDPYGLGLAHYLYWPVTFKRGGIKFWMKFVERFAQPGLLGKFREGTPDDSPDIDNLLNALKSLASETGTVIPDSMTIDTIEASRNGTSDYSKVIEIMDKAISKVIVGQTMTTDDGSSQAQAKVHYDVRQDLIDADSDLICESYNDGPMKWSTELNFPGAGIPILSRKTTPDEDLDHKVERDVKLSGAGVKMTQEYVNETYGEGYIVDHSQPIQDMPEVNDSDFMEFAENFFPDQRDLDEALDSMTDMELNDQMESIINPILDFAEKHGPDKTLKQMSKVYEGMDDDDLIDQLTQVFFVAENWGRHNADK